MRKSFTKFFGFTGEFSGRRPRCRTSQFEELSSRVPFAADVAVALTAFESEVVVAEAQNPVSTILSGDAQIPVEVAAPSPGVPIDNLSLPIPANLSAISPVVALPSTLTPANFQLPQAAVDAVFEFAPIGQSWGAALESFDGSYAATNSNFNDGYGGEINTPPMIAELDGNVVNSRWVLTGRVIDDESMEGCTVTFGGLLEGETAVVQDNRFILTTQLSLGISGILTAFVTDIDGLNSQPVTFILI